MPARNRDLLFDQVDVVEQPFAGRGQAPVGLCRRSEQAAGAVEHLLVVTEPAEQAIDVRLRAEAMAARQLSAMALHVLGTEQLLAQRLLARR